MTTDLDTQSLAVASLMVPDALADEPARVAAGWLLGYAGNTRAAYARDLACYGRFLAERGLEPLAVPRAGVEAYARWLSEDQARSPATVARRLAALAGFYAYALDEGLIARSPLSRVRRPRTGGDSQALGIDREGLRAFLAAAAAAGPRDRALAELLALNGLRVSEACAADVEDLGVERGHQVLRVTRKGGARVVVPLAPRTRAAIADHLGERSDGPLVLANSGGRLDRHASGRIVRRLARRAELGALGPHALRHAFVTAALDAGVPLRDVQDAAGHADPRTTRRYDRGRMSLDRHATYAVAAWVSG